MSWLEMVWYLQLYHIQFPKDEVVEIGRWDWPPNKTMSNCSGKQEKEREAKSSEWWENSDGFPVWNHKTVILS